MRKLFLFFVVNIIIFTAVSISISFDVDNEGILNFGKYYSTIKFNADTMAEHNADENSLIEIVLPNKISRRVLRTLTQIDDKVDELKDYIDHIIKTCTLNLKYTGEQILKQVNVENNAFQKISIATNNYIKKIKNYFHYINEKESTGVVDEHYIFLNVLQTACKLLFVEQWQLLKEGIEDINHKDSITEKALFDNFREASEVIYDNALHYKKQEIQYICNNYNICVAYPGFGDYCSKFIKELLSLPKEEIRIIVKDLSRDIHSNKYFLAMIEGTKAHNNKTLAEIHNFYNFTNLESILSNAIQTLNQRYKIIHISDSQTKLRIQALRLLLDTIDQSYQNNYDNGFYSEFENIIRSINRWRDKNEDINVRAIYSFINKIFGRIFKRVQDLKGIISNMIVKRTPEEEKLDEHLFLEGFKGVYTSQL